ncbi:MAG: hemerythrin domain-containing protein [Metallosphaera sp.]|uniref:hemerythrin domain-containing protein n=1 Tax=Metallosphaera sp. TaxID=2020860 RepID=UPI0031605A3E
MSNSISLYMTNDHVKGDEELETSLVEMRQGDLETASKNFESARKRIKLHIYIEEEILFPELKDADLSGWISELMMQHVAIWNLLDQIHVGMLERDKEIETKLVLLIQLLKAHNSIEEHSIYKEFPDIDVIHKLSGAMIPEDWKPKFM